MKWRLPAIVLTAAGAAWLAGGASSLTQDIVARVGPFRQQVQQEVEAHAARSNLRARLPEGNSSCLVCHINLEEELLVTTHLNEGITCAHCHGVSYEHCDDEANVVNPDVMFGRAEVAPFCERCHGPHEDQQEVEAFLAEHKGKPGPSGREIVGLAVCTHCHGTHTLPGYVQPEAGE